VCLVYDVSVDVSKKYIAERYFITLHKVIRQERNTVRRNELEYLKYNLRSRQTALSKPINKNRADIIAFCQVTDILAKRKEEKRRKRRRGRKRSTLKLAICLHTA
jgi:hypothetical protein